MSMRLAVALTLLGSSPVLAQTTLQVDGFVSGQAAGFQAGFVAGEIAAVVLTPPPGVWFVTKVQFLFGGSSTATRDITAHVWDGPPVLQGGTNPLGLYDAPTAELYTADFSVTGSDTGLQELTIDPVPVTGSFVVGIELQTAGLPSLARDDDGNINGPANFILADGVGWLRSNSPFIGLVGDWIIRAEIIPAGSVDAGVVMDAAVAPDAAVTPDAAVAPDASVTPDAAVAGDGSVPGDASVDADASVGADASVTQDAGGALDGAVSSDGAVVGDASAGVDAAGASDAAMGVDVQPPPDAAVRPDAAVTADAAVTGDAGSNGGCQTNAQCTAGQYCGANGACTFDCTVDADCGANMACNSLGRCVATTPPEEDTGCGCTTAANNAWNPGVLLGGALVLMGLRRARRRR